MVCIRRICTNYEEIQQARAAQTRVLAEDAGEIPELQRNHKMEIPKPNYEQFQYAFHLRNVVNFYVEVSDDGSKDIVFTEAGIGNVRCVWEPHIEQQFTMFMNLGL